MTEDSNVAPEPLFYEQGASWYWLLAGPASGIAMLLIQFKGGVGLRPFVPMVFLVLVTGFLCLQVKAARIHTSVELTPEALREGTEVTPLRTIVGVYPEAAHSAQSLDSPEKWQSARALGELSGVPRGRTGIGLRLSGDRTAQAWARNHRELRAQLNKLLDARTASS